MNYSASFFLPVIEFESNEAKLKDAVKMQLVILSEILKKYPNLCLSIEGHTDNEGDEQRNLLLSFMRAEVVKQELINSGIAPNRLIIKGWGAKKPLDNRNLENSKAKNRRVEFWQL